MKIALVIYPINDFGGIINHVENLAYGLRELGHSVNFHILYWQENFSSSFRLDSDLYGSGDWSRGAFCAVSQGKGWNVKPWIHKLAYKGIGNLSRTKEILSSYDLVIWEVPVPTRTKNNKGNTDWYKLYSACTKNIAIIHDGNMHNTPWICAIRNKLDGLACVHECAYNTAKALDVPRALILNPQDLSGAYEPYDYLERQKGFLSLQNFKGWKHVDQLIRAIPYVSPEIRKVMAGGGIEQRYMVSRTKIKERYICKSGYDPDLLPGVDESRMSIWDRALHYEMEWKGFIPGFQVDVLLAQLRTLIDPSWSIKYSKMGGHFNRVVVEAMKRGAIPIAVNLGMSNNEAGNGAVFTSRDNYIMIPYNYPPKEYGAVINYANSLPTSDAARIQENNYSLLSEFDRVKVAQDYIDLSEGRSCGFFNKRSKGKLDPELLEASKKELKNFFGITRKRKE